MGCRGLGVGYPNFGMSVLGCIEADFVTFGFFDELLTNICEFSINFVDFRTDFDVMSSEFH